MNMVDLGSLAQISGAIGRSTSPVAGAAYYLCIPRQM